MSRHEGVSCDSCSTGNFRGKRFKCLICYDYDLCATCYENGATTTRHTADHPMQCILTRTDFELYYGGEAFTADQPQAFTCPYCGKMGFTETALQEHVASEHSDASIEVVCPVCAALPGGDPNHVTDDFAAHLTLEHRAPSRPDMLDERGEPPPVRHVRRLFHPAVSGRIPRPPRPRATNMHFGGSGGSGLSSSSSSSSTSARESMDPIAELLSQLSGVRRQAQQPQAPMPMQSQLQLLQQQLQLERQQVQQTRERLERLPARRQMAAAAAAASSSAPTTSTVSAQESSNSPSSSFLLARANEPSLSEAEQETLERERADRSLFVQDLILSTLGSAAFRRRTRPSSSVRETSDGFTSLTIQDSTGIQASADEMRAEARDCNVIEQDITVQDMELISLETEEDKDS